MSATFSFTLALSEDVNSGGVASVTVKVTFFSDGFPAASVATTVNIYSFFVLKFGLFLMLTSPLFVLIVKESLSSPSFKLYVAVASLVVAVYTKVLSATFSFTLALSEDVNSGATSSLGASPLGVNLIMKYEVSLFRSPCSTLFLLKFVDSRISEVVVFILYSLVSSGT